MRDILVADPIAKSAIVSLQTLGMNVINKPTLTTKQLADNISNAEILIVRSTSVDEATIAAAINLALIVRAGADVNSIDVNAATRNGIYVANYPGRNAAAVAELVVGLLDVISIHLAANSSTYHLVDRRFLQQMRDGAYLINTSRGEIVDTFALKEAIYQKSLRVALDVFEDEPLKDGNTFEDPELAQMIVATPHIAASTRQALEAISREVIRIIGIFIASGTPPNAINAPAERREPSVKNRIEYTY